MNFYVKIICISFFNYGVIFERADRIRFDMNRLKLNIKLSKEVISD